MAHREGHSGNFPLGYDVLSSQMFLAHDHNCSVVPTDRSVLRHNSGAASEDSDAALAAAAEGLDVAESPVSPPAPTGPSAAAVGALARFGLSARQGPEVILPFALIPACVPARSLFGDERPHPHVAA